MALNDDIENFTTIATFYNEETEIERLMKKNTLEIDRLIFMIEVDVFTAEELCKQIKKIKKNNKKIKKILKKYFKKNNF